MLIKELFPEDIYKCVFDNMELVVLVFYTDQFEPCKDLLVQLNKLSNESKINIYKVDYQIQKELVNIFEIVSLPTVIMLKEGYEKYRFTGTITNQQIEIFISMLN